MKHWYELACSAVREGQIKNDMEKMFTVLKHFDGKYIIIAFFMETRSQIVCHDCSVLPDGFTIRLYLFDASQFFFAGSRSTNFK